LICYDRVLNAGGWQGRVCGICDMSGGLVGWLCRGLANFFSPLQLKIKIKKMFIIQRLFNLLNKIFTSLNPRPSSL
jgi:hypothetical protein